MGHAKGPALRRTAAARQLGRRIVADDELVLGYDLDLAASTVWTFLPTAGHPSEELVLWIQDGRDAGPAVPDAFDAAIGGPTTPGDCATNFPLDRFDNTRIQLYTVTQGQIKIR